jgi:diguanylate cyclase (GGDEF)-like protein
MTERTGRIQEFVNGIAASVAVALPDTDLDDAFSIADKLRAAFAEGNFIHTWRTGRAIPFTVSIGVATRAPSETEVGQVLKCADQALYKAKQNGRNRVERA